MLVIESVDSLAVVIAEMTGIVPSEVKHHHLRSELAGFPSLLSLCPHDNFEEVVTGIACNFWLSAYLEDVLSKFPWPSIAFFLRIQRHSRLQPDEQISGLVWYVRLDQF